MSTVRSPMDLADILAEYPGDVPEDMERRLKAALVQASELTRTDAKALRIGPEWFGDILYRLYCQGVKATYKDMGEAIRISRATQLRLERIGY